MMDRDTLLDLLAPYALGILDADAQRQVEALLAEDAQARQLLADYRIIAEAVALTAPAKPPAPALERKLLQRARRKRGGRRLLLMGTAAALLVLVVATALRVQRYVDAPDARQMYASLAADPDGAHISLVPGEIAEAQAVEGDLVYEADGSAAIIRVSNLPALEDGQAFQLWLVDESGSTSGGVFRFAESPAYIAVPISRPVREYLRFGVSIEPAEGSPLGNRPTGPRVFSISVSATPAIPPVPPGTPGIPGTSGTSQ